jgi:hypothetical protein
MIDTIYKGAIRVRTIHNSVFTKADLPFVVGLPFLFTAKQALGGAL